MSSYTLVVFIHIAAAVALLGTSVVGEPIVQAAARRAPTVSDLRAQLAVGRPMAVVSPIAALILLGSGVYLTSIGRFWSLGWVQVATAFWVVNSVVAVALVRPAIQRVAAEAARGTELAIGPRLDALRWSRSWTVGGDLLAVNDAAMLYLMTVKPSLGGSLTIVIVANLVVAGGRAMFGRAPLPALTT